MSKLTITLAATLLILPAFAATGQAVGQELYLSHPPTRDKGPFPPVNLYHATWATSPVVVPAHPPTLDWGPGAVRPHSGADKAMVIIKHGIDHPPTRDWGPGSL